MAEDSSSQEPWQLSATEALNLIQRDKLKVEDYVESLLSRIKERDAAVKAWVHIDTQKVLQKARELDQIPRDKRGPLHGLPIGVKDIILTQDYPTQYNSPIYESKKPISIDAAPIITLRAAGVLILGKTTTTEFAANAVGGYHQNFTSNPFDIHRTPGGSSSGSAAAVGDFQVPIALGTQTGGSVIRPGSFCGSYAFKPTWGAISREGLSQYSITCDTFGIFSRSVEDLELLAKVFQLADDKPVSQGNFNLQSAKIGMCKTYKWPNAGRGLHKAWTKAQQILKDRGAEVEEFELPEDFSNISEWQQRVMDGEGRVSFLGNYLLNKDKLHSQMVGQVENESRISRKDQLEAYDGCARLRPIWDSIASKYDAILTPSVPDEAPEGIGWTGNVAFCGMWTILHTPALNVPGFAGDHGLPVGLTLVGPRYTDLHVLHAGKVIGEVFEKYGGWTRPIN